jgi:hypothetical protein
MSSETLPAAAGPEFSDNDNGGFPDSGGDPLGGAEPDINPRTGKPYKMPLAERLKIGRQLAESRAAAARERGARPGSRNAQTGKGTKPGRPGRPAAPPRTTAPKPTKEATPEEKALDGAHKVSQWLAFGGAFMMTRNPVRGAIVVNQAASLEPVLQSLAGAYPVVRDGLASLADLAKPAGAWSDAAVWAGATAGALALSSGRPPAGLVGTALAALGGAVLDQALQRTAMAQAATGPGPDGASRVDMARAEQIYAELLARYGRVRPGPDAPAGGPMPPAEV